MPNPAEKRAKLIQLISIAKQQLGIEEEIWRGHILPRYGAKEKNGKLSLTTLPIYQLENVLKELKQKGFSNPNSNSMSDLEYIRRLWSDLHQMGVVRDGSEQALIRWAKNRFNGLDKLEWLNTYQKQQMIEALKNWIAREKRKANETKQHTA